MNASSRAVSFDKVSFGFGKKRVLQDFSLDVNQGDVLCIIGASGSGKTTLLRLLTGALRPSKGTISLAGHSPVECRSLGLVSYVPQQPSLLPWLNVYQNVALPFKLRKRHVERERIMQALEKVGLQDAARLRPKELSGGMQARAALARAWVDTSAPILFMDEPFASLDELRREDLGILLRALADDRSKTLIYVTHHISEAILLGSRILTCAPDGFVGQAEVVEITSEQRDQERQLMLSPLHQCFRSRLGAETMPQT